MRSPSASDTRALVAGIATFVVFAAGSGAAIAQGKPDAKADAKRECTAAYDDVQALRADGKLGAARKQAVACASDACPGFIKVDCAKWLTEIDGSTPTVVFEVRDAFGKETTAARVDLDGKPWIDVLDGKARALDPGTHTLHYELPGGAALDDTVQIREGQKNRTLRASFQAAAPAPALPPDEPRRSVGPWVLGGAGLAGLAVGGVLGAFVLYDASVTSGDGCNASTHTCRTPAGLSAAQQGRALGPATTIALAVGGAGLAGGLVWLLATGPARASAPAALGFGTTMTAAGATWRLHATW
jgi:hypothetical protein